MKRLIVSLLVATSLVLLGLSAAHLRERASGWIDSLVGTPAEEQIPTILLEKNSYQVLVAAEGELTGLKTTPVLTPRVRTGSLKISWLVEEGIIVNPGDPLIRFDSTDAELALESSQNTFDSYVYKIQKSSEQSRSEQEVLQKNRAAADLEVDFARSQIRKDEEIFSQWEIQESIVSAALAEFRQGALAEKAGLRDQLTRSELKILNIEQRKAETEKKLAEETLSSLMVAAPVGGIVLYQRMGMSRLQAGQEVWPGQSLISLADTGQFLARLQVHESSIAGVEAGKKVLAQLHSLPGRTFTGSVQSVDKIPQQRSRNDPRKFFSCSVALEVGPEVLPSLKPGVGVSAQLEVGGYPEAVSLPKSAVFSKDGRFFVFLREGEQYREQAVTILNSDHGFYIVEGLAAGLQVCLQHPYEKQNLRLPDFNAPSSNARGRRYVIY